MRARRAATATRWWASALGRVAAPRGGVRGLGVDGGFPVEPTREGDERLRLRVLLRIRNPPLGGAETDYDFWARSAHVDVTRAWVRPLAGGLGTLTVYFMTDEATANGIPVAAVVTTVTGYIGGLRPVTADVTVAAPLAVALDVTIDSLLRTRARCARRSKRSSRISCSARPSRGAPYASPISPRRSRRRRGDRSRPGSSRGDVAHNANQIAVPGTVTWL